MHSDSVPLSPTYVIEEIKQDFQDGVDDYLEFCADLGREPDRFYSGIAIAS